MEKVKSLLLPFGFIILSVASILGGFWSFLMFPAVAMFFIFLVKVETFKPEIKTVVIGACLFAIFFFWHSIQYDTQHLMFILTYTLAGMTAIEGWRFTSHTKTNLWGLMNLVVLWLAMEYITFVWLPFDVSGWYLGTPLLLNEEASAQWLLFVGKQGFTLWVFIGALLLYKGLANIPRGMNILMILAALLVIILPVLLSPGFKEDAMLYAQGEWIGRTCIWLSILILAYGFVKKKTKK